MLSCLSSKKHDVLYNSFIEITSEVSDLSFILESGRGSPRRDLNYIACFLSPFQKGIKCNSFGIKELNLE